MSTEKSAGDGEPTLKILVLHGPNLNLLGTREPHIYGKTTLEEINNRLLERAHRLAVELEIHQSNHEGDLINVIHKNMFRVDGIIINPGAFTHYSYAIRDALSATGLPIIEVHLSNIYSREDFRKISVIAPITEGQITGLGAFGYELALEGIVEIIKNKKTGDMQC